MKGLKVLIVDDSTATRHMLKEVFVDLEVSNVIEAVDGLDGVAKYKEHNPDLVTMDLDMPNVNGFDAIEAIQKLDPDSNIIVVTSDYTLESAIKVKKLGAYDVVVKPFQPQQIKIVVEKMFKEKKPKKVSSETPNKKEKPKLLNISNKKSNANMLIDENKTEDNELKTLSVETLNNPRDLDVKTQKGIPILSGDENTKSIPTLEPLEKKDEDTQVKLKTLSAPNVERFKDEIENKAKIVEDIFEEEDDYVYSTSIVDDEFVLENEEATTKYVKNETGGYDLVDSNNEVILSIKPPKRKIERKDTASEFDYLEEDNSEPLLVDSFNQDEEAINDNKEKEKKGIFSKLVRTLNNFKI